MSVYWFIAILTLLLNRILPTRTEKEYLKNLIISFIPLFVYAAIRVDYGNDYPAYEIGFYELHYSGPFVPDYDRHAEVGYQLLCYLMPSYRSILVLTALTLSSALIILIYNNIPSKYAWLAILLVFLMPEKNIFGSLVGIRNGLVVTSFMLTFTFVQKRKYYVAIPVFLLLSTIHTSAILYLPLAYLVARNTPMTKKEVYIWIGLGIIILGLSVSSLINIMQPIFSLVANRYEEELLELKGDDKGMLASVSSMIIMVAIILFTYHNDSSLSPNQKSLLRMAALYCTSSFIGPISGRMTYYFALYYIGGVVTMYSIPWKYEFLKKAMLILVIAIACYATFYVWMGSPWWNNSEYHSIFD